MAMILDKTILDPSLDVRREVGITACVYQTTVGSKDNAEKDPQAVYGRQPSDPKATQKSSGKLSVSSSGKEYASTKVSTTRFGMLEVDLGLVLTFPDGLIGMEHCQRYIVVRHDDNSAFRWLQSLDDPTFALPIIEPGEFCQQYAPTISDADARALDLTAEVPTLLFTVVTVPKENPRAMTANLLAPLVINGITRHGKQVIIQNDGYTTRHKIIDELARRQKRKAA